MNKVLFSVCAASLLASGCIPIVVGGAATAGYLYSKEEGIGTAVDDTRIQAHIKDRLTADNYKYLTDIDIAVLKGDVLLTGVVGSKRESANIDALVRTVEGVYGVHNQLFTDGIYTTKQYSRDSLVAVSIRGRLISSNDVAYRNISTTVVNGHGYLMGIARSQTEMTKALHLARTTKGVLRVHNYISLRGAPSIAQQQQQRLTIPTIEEN
jgi:osmotically-inducible protein OsmY